MITDSEFHRVVTYVKRISGIDLSEKRVLINGRLKNYLLRNGYSSYNEYMEKVERDPKGKEARNLINALTTNHTYFMREFEHMEFMQREILPKLKVKEAARRDLSIFYGRGTLHDRYGVEGFFWDGAAKMGHENFGN